MCWQDHVVLGKQGTDQLKLTPWGQRIALPALHIEIQVFLFNIAVVLHRQPYLEVA
jgi:hypothetical protein